LTEVLERKVNTDHVWNCPRVTALSDGRLVIVGDRVSGAAEGSESGEQSNWLWFSSDNGESWEGPHATPVSGIVPDQLIELKLGEHAGRWLLSAHTRRPVDGVPMNMQRCWWSD